MKYFSNIIVILIIGSFAYLTSPLWLGSVYEAELKFSKESWSDASKFNREGMARDLLSSEQLMFMSRSDVIALLGEPDLSSSSRLDYAVSQTTMDYIMLVILFDTNERVSEAFIYQN
jgi:hypothetical protein